MFLRERKGMEVIQVIVLGMLLVGLGVFFISRVSGGVGTAGDNVNSAVQQSSQNLLDAVNDLQP